MSEVLRIELAGKNADAWNRVFSNLTRALENAIEQLAPDATDSDRKVAKELTADIAEITKGWMKARLERPTLENERILADIAARFEELKLAQSQRNKIEAETEAIRIENERKKLTLIEEQISTALRVLGMLQRHIVRNADGSVILLLTNEILPILAADTRALAAPETSSQ